MSNEKKEFEILFRDIYPKLYYAAQQAINRHVAAEEGLPFDLDQEWTKVSAMMKEEETSDENLSGDSGKPQEEKPFCQVGSWSGSYRQCRCTSQHLF